MNTILKYLTVLILLLIISCRSNKKNIKYEYQLVKDDSLSIYVPDTIPDIDAIQNWYIVDKFYTLGSNLNGISILRYNFDNKLWDSKCVSCLENYPINKISSYSLVNDSIIIYAYWPKNKYLIINLESRKVIDEVKVSNDYTILNNRRLQIYVDSNKIVLPIFYRHNYDNSFAKNAKLALVYNRITKKVNYFGMFPKSIMVQQNSSLNMIMPNIVFNKNNYVANFKGEEYLYEYYYDSVEYKTVICKDENVIKQDGINKTGVRIKDALIEELKGLYKELLFDKQYKRYFRISISYPDFNGQVPNSREEITKLFSNRKILITALDKDLKIIARNYVHGVTENTAFVREGKLYMKSSERKEDNKLTYYAYKLIKNQ